MNDEQRLQLLTDLLNAQPDIPSAAMLSEARLRAALTDGPGFDEDEKRLIWHSPAVRERYLQVKQALRHDEMRRRLRAAGIDTQLHLRAAASDPGSP